MASIANIFGAAGPITFQAPESARTRFASSSGSSSNASATQFSEMNTIYRRVLELDRALQDANAVFDSLRTGQSAAGRGLAVSSSALDLDPTPRCSTLDSTEEVNTVPTSYTPHGPSWTGSSTTPVTVTGTYNGDYGDDTLRFQVTRSRTVGGSRNIRIKVYDSSGTRLQNLNWAAGTPPDTPQYSSKTGLWVSLGAGATAKNDTFYVDVSTSVDSEIDPDKPFNGTRNDMPELEPGYAVTDGSFFVNGEEIAVSEGDTLSEVLDRVNASAAGVTAIYDPSTELVSFEADAAGEEDIVLSGDTSGFLDAMKLTGATVVLGSEDGDLGAAMEEVDALAATVAGSITVNEQEIALDPSTDSLDDVLDAINASDAGVTASFDADSCKVTIAAAGGDVVLEDGGTNFLSQVEIDPGTYAGRTANRMSKIAARKASRALANVQTAFEKLQACELSEGSAQTVLNNVISKVEAAMTSALSDASETLEDAGLSFDLGADDTGDLMDLVATRFERGLRSSDGADIKAAMVGSMLDSDDGLLGEMEATVEALKDTLKQSCGDVSVYLNTYA